MHTHTLAHTHRPLPDLKKLRNEFAHHELMSNLQSKPGGVS
jgi:hypothetical protein